MKPYRTTTRTPSTISTRESNAPFINRNEEDNGIFISDGLRFRKIESDKAEVIGWTEKTASVSSIIIPPFTARESRKVCRIGNFAFKNALKLRAITLPSTVTEIGSFAFANTPLTSINFPHSIEYIGKGAFSGTLLTNADMLSCSVKVLEHGTFMNSALRSIALPATLTEIKDRVFESCFQLTEITLPDHVRKIGQNVFFSCNQLKKFASGQKLSSIGKDSFCGCSSLIEIPNPCEFLRNNVKLLLSDTGIYQNAIYNHAGLKIVLSTLIDVKCPDNRYYRPIISLPANVEVIDSYAFKNFNEPTVIEIPQSVRLIRENAFVTKAQRLTVDEDGFIIKTEGWEIAHTLSYDGSVENWCKIERTGNTKHPVAVTCKNHPSKSTDSYLSIVSNNSLPKCFIDYI